MSRALRLERTGGRYHVTARGNERKAIFSADPGRFHFLEQLSESEPAARGICTRELWRVSIAR
jgi:REP element-mobilizing transposase RayT